MTEVEIAERAVEAYKLQQLIGYATLAAIFFGFIFIREWWRS